MFAAERMKLVLEPAGAAGVARGAADEHDSSAPVVVILSGGNIDPLLLLSVIRFGLSAVGPLLRVQHPHRRPTRRAAPAPAA